LVFVDSLIAMGDERLLALGARITGERIPA
jgi:hypothetical protein